MYSQTDISLLMNAVSNTHLLANSAQNGGAVFLSNCSDSVLTGNTYTSNTASVQGGALYAEKCAGDYLDSTYVANGAQRAGAIYFTNARYCLFQVKLHELQDIAFNQFHEHCCCAKNKLMSLRKGCTPWIPKAYIDFGRSFPPPPFPTTTCTHACTHTPPSLRQAILILDALPWELYCGAIIQHGRAHVGGHLKP